MIDLREQSEINILPSFNANCLYDDNQDSKVSSAFAFKTVTTKKILKNNENINILNFDGITSIITRNLISLLILSKVIIKHYI